MYTHYLEVLLRVDD